MIAFEKIKQSPLVKQFIENRFDNKNVLVYAEGGFGKTTAMRCLQAYLLYVAQKEKIVPLYIDVKKIDQFSNKPLMHYIYTKYSGSDTKESDVENLFTDQAPSTQYKYKYYILIDGYNEVPVSARFNINSEISDFVQKKNVRIILSSRLNEQVDIFKGFKRISLLGLNDAHIKSYLKKHFDMDFDLEKVNQSLVNILRSPLYMSAFSKTYGIRNPSPELLSKKEVRKGDILDNFMFYSLDKLRPNESINDLLAEFILLYFMPALAFKMYKNESFAITKKDMEKFINDVDYFKSLLDIDKQAIYLGEYSRNIYDIEKICCDNIAALQRTGYGYELHNIYRDFFVAKQVINFINVGLINELEIDLDENIRQFVGELIREYDRTHLYSRDYANIYSDDRKCECDFEAKNNLEAAESPIEHFLQRHNLKSSMSLSPIATKNLIEVMKTCRNRKITAKYDDLDLKYVKFYKCNLEMSTFNNTKIYYYNFIPTGHSRAVNSVAFSEDGSKIVSGSNDATIRVWDVESGLLIGNPLEGPGASISVSFLSSDKIVSASNHGTIQIWDSETRTKVVQVDIASDVMSAAISPDGTKIAFGEDAEAISIWNVETGKRQRIVVPLPYIMLYHISSVAFSPDGKKIVSGVSNKTIRIWDVETGEPIGDPLVGHTGYVTSVAFSSNGEKIVSGSHDETIRIWDAETGKPIGDPLVGHTGYVTSVAFSTDGKRIAGGINENWGFRPGFVSFRGGDILICNVETGEVFRHKGIRHKGAVTSVSFSPNGKRLVSGSQDKTIRIWETETGKQIGNPLLGHTASVNSVEFLHGGNMIVSGSDDGTIRIWDLENYLCLVIQTILQSCVQGCDFRFSKFQGKTQCEFYQIIYFGGGKIKDEFNPKQIPFQYLKTEENKTQKSISKHLNIKKKIKEFFQSKSKNSDSL